MAQNSGVNGVSHGPNTEFIKSFACLACRQRKIKCDRRHPCSHCVKISKDCIFIAPVRGKRKRTKHPKEGLHAKLKRYEQLLKSYGAKIEPSDDEESSDDETSSRHDLTKSSPSLGESQASPFDESKAQIIHKDGSSRYFENTLWSRIGPELENEGEQELVDALRDGIGKGGIGGGCIGGPPNASFLNINSDPLDLEENGLDALVLSAYPDVQYLASLHPPPETVQSLWTIFLERVDPLIKLLHTPTFRISLINVLHNPHNVSRSLEALVFAFYTSVFSSLDDGECERLMGDQKHAVVMRYRRACRQALINASFIKTSSFETLQAYVLFMLGTRGVYQSDAFFVMSGIAVRLARRMGCHRDGTFLGLSPFESEMRRRLWWQIVHVDSRSSDFSGTRPSMDLILSDTKPPINILDEDLTPEMTSLPPERQGITPCVLTIIRCDITKFLRKITPRSQWDGHWERLTSSHLSVEEKDSLINQIEELLETKYIQYCDPSVPLHFFTSVIARSALCKLRMFAHNPRQFADRGVKLPQKDRDVIWANGRKLLEYGNALHGHARIRPFTWQVGSSYLWDTLLYVLIETRHRRAGPDVDRTWLLIAAAFDHYPQLFQTAADPLFVALGNWTLQVWDECAAACAPPPPEPPFIASIRRCRRANAVAASEDVRSAAVPAPLPVAAAATASGSATAASDYGGQNVRVDEIPAGDCSLETYDFSNLLSFDLEPDEWAQWERLLAGRGV